MTAEAAAQVDPTEGGRRIVIDGRRLTTPKSLWGNGVNPGGNHRARAGVVGVPGPPFVR